MSEENISLMGKVKSKLLGTYGIVSLVVLAGFIATFQFVEPAPSKTLTIATGSTSGAYFRYATEYKSILKKQGITLNIIQTKGSVDNLARISGKSAVDLAFVQGGISANNKALTSLGSMYLEPLWVFYKSDETLSKITQLKGKRIAVGADGSGTQALAKLLLEKNKITQSNARFKSMSGDKAASEITAGNVDVMFVVASPNAPLIQKLLRSKELKLMSFSRAQAYARAYRYLTVVTMPEGSVDFSGNIPAAPVKLLATTANLVANKKMHPALVVLLLQAAVQAHETHGLFSRRGEFPTRDFVSLPLNHAAGLYYKNGTPFLQRYLPFWLASLLDRLKIMLLPLLGLMIPLFKLMPPLYRWRIRKRIYSWYAELRAVDPELMEIPAEDIDSYLDKLEDMEQEVTRVSVPLSYADEVYNLRLHIDMVRNELNKYRETGSTRS